MDENLALIQKKVRPIQQMADTVKLCKGNINTALEQINKVTANISEQREVVDILTNQRGLLKSEFDVYIGSMRRAQDLVKYFGEELAYFKDSYSLAEQLVSFIGV